MNVIPGPKKLVLIRSGVYPYAEIDLDESVHLSGRNNAGKTSLLNALQFLYIDDIRYMHFPNDNFRLKTMPFYFKPHGKSTILIEADTKWGTRTVGFHGMGSSAGCDWQRFGFEGPYEKSDFIDPETEDTRDWGAVKALLAVKGYVELTQAQLRIALRGSGDKNSFRLELVPGGGNYDTFIEVFRQLLSLRKSGPNDLKNLLLSVIDDELISGDERGKGIVSLASVVADDYNRAFAASLRYERIVKAEKGCQSLFADFDVLVGLQKALPITMRTAYEEGIVRSLDRKRKIADIRSEAEEVKERAGTLDCQQKSLDDSLKQLNRKIGTTETILGSMQLAKERLEETTKDLLEGRLVGLQEETGRLRADLSAFHGVKDPSAELKARANRHRQSRQAILDAVQRLWDAAESGTHTTWMDILSEYPEEERDPLLRLLNPAVLRLPEGEKGMEVLDPGSIGKLIGKVAGASVGGVFRGAGVAIHLAAIPAPLFTLDDPVEREREIERQEAEAEKHDQEAKRLDLMAENNRSRELLEKKLVDLDKESGVIRNDLLQIASWEALVEGIPAKQEELDKLVAECARQEAAKTTAADKHERCRDLVRVLEGRLGNLSKEVLAIQGHLQVLEQTARGFMEELFPEDVTQEKPRMIENTQQMDLLRQFTQPQGLFGDATLSGKAMEQIGKMLEQGKVFKLFDLFSVSLDVVKDGEKVAYASMDAESTGTAVTLKVIFLAHLLRDLYKTRTEVKLLIFVDEVDTLDDVNQETIRECARELGFVMIMASPNPANAQRLYFLRPEGKVTYIYPEEALDVVFRDEPELSGDLEEEGDAASAETIP